MSSSGGGGAQLLDRGRAGACCQVVGEVGWGEVDVEVRRSGAGTLAGRRTFAAGEQVQGVLWVGEDPDRAGPAHIDGVGVAEIFEVACDPADGRVEEVGVGGVQRHRDVSGRGTTVPPQPDTALGESLLLVGHRAVGVEVEPGLLHQPFGVDLVDPGRGGGDQPVGEQGGLDGEVGGLPGDQPGPPHRNRSGPDQVPEPWEAVGELEGVGDQLAGGVVADREGGGQVGGGELRHPRGAGAGERGQGLAVQVDLAPVRRGLVGRAGVQVCPDQGELEFLDRCGLGRATSGADTVDHLGGGERWVVSMEQL